jgi:glycerol-3-phosphate dehydrogenase subunit C
MAGGDKEGSREGSLEAPTRHPIAWREADFWDGPALEKELERVYDICHGCRRCVSLCNAFPTLFDLVDESSTMEVDGIAKSDYNKVVDHCYLCDLCYLTKCPYVPPHQWNVDFPHLMLRAKAQKFKRGGASLRDRLLTSTDMVGSIAGVPVIAQAVNAANRLAPVRRLMDKSLGIHPDAVLPEFHSNTARRRIASRTSAAPVATPTDSTKGKVALFVTCYGNRNEPGAVEDLVSVFEHNGVPVTLAPQERCCGMPKLELGDLESVAKLKEFNVPMLASLVDQGYDIIAPIPSCVLMFKQEIPLLFPEDPQVAKVQQAMFDPFEYLMLRHKAGLLNTQFHNSLGKVAYHVACHQRVQKIGLKTRDVLQLVPDTTIEVIERCSGHDGTYAVKSEFHTISMKIVAPVVSRVEQSDCDHYASDCPMAGHQIDNGMTQPRHAESPFSLLRKAYGI